MTLPVSYPTKASSAKLTVSGVFGHVQTIENITSSSVEVSLPEPLNPVNLPSTENIYDLKLEFDDGTVRTASLALIAGLAGGGQALRAASLLIPGAYGRGYADARWCRFHTE